MIVQKSKAPLSLMEQVVMILVFAFAAALCVQAFVLADTMSQEAYERDKAAIISQAMAETVKSQKGDMEKVCEILNGHEISEGVILYYDREWKPCAEEGSVYLVELTIIEKGTFLTKAEIVAKAVKEKKLIFKLPVNWQNTV